MPPPHRHIQNARSLRRLAVRISAAALLLGACGGGEPAPAEPPPQLHTVRRVLDRGEIGATDPRLVRGTHVFLGGEARPTLSAAKAFPSALRCESAPRMTKRPCVATLPTDVPPAQAVILSRRTRAAAEHEVGTPHPPEASAAAAAAPGGAAPPDATVAAPAPSPAAGADPPWRSLVLREGHPIPAGDLDGVDIFFARTLAVPALHERTHAAAPFTVPPNAWLRLSIGVEPAAWYVDSAPVVFRVQILDESGATQDLFRRTLDPARRPQDRRWFDSDVDLSDLAGKPIVLRFVTEPAERDDQRPSLPLWGDPRVVAPAAERRPSVVLVSLDTLRAKSMSTYGYALETTPHMSALAAQGAVFENAFTTFSNTLPAHMSMLTGLYPATHGVIRFGQVLRGRHPTLAELLRGAGYGTAAFTEDALLDARHGFMRGFSAYDEDTEVAQGSGDAEATFGRALEWAGRHADESFFLFAHTYQVHWPYEPPDAYRNLFTGPDAGARRRAYEQEIRYTDDVLRRFVDGLRRVVPERDLVIVVTSDHGEEFHDHGLFTHHQLYEEVMRVPLIMVGSGRIPPGVRIATPVSLVDVAPTILALAGVSVPFRLDGTSLVPLLSGQTTTLERAAVFAEFPKSAIVPEHHFVARTEHAKCFLGESGGRDACFDLRADPDERHPRPSKDASAFAELHAHADAYRRRALAARSAAAAAADDDDDDDDDDDVDPVKRKLRALGYVE